MGSVKGIGRSADIYDVVRRISIIIVVAVALSTNVFGQIGTDIQLKVTGLTDSAAPEVFGRYVIFSYVPDHPVRHVGVSFEHEDFRDVWNLDRNQHGVYLLLYQPPEGSRELIYRYVVDGLWQTDPKNPDYVTEAFLPALSRFESVGAFPVTPTSPIIDLNGRTELYYYGDTGKLIYATGDFSSWDPFLFRVPEIRSGVYRLQLTLPPGAYGYQFIVDGNFIPDPLNPNSVNRDQGVASVLFVPERQ